MKVLKTSRAHPPGIDVHRLVQGSHGADTQLGSPAMDHAFRQVLIAAFAAVCTTSASTADTPLPSAPLPSPISIEEARVENRCITPSRKPIFGASLTDEVFDARFHFVKRAGRGNGVLYEFSRSCDNLTLGGTANAAMSASCRNTRLTIDNEVCRIESLYRVADEAEARQLALQIIARNTEADNRPQD